MGQPNLDRDIGRHEAKIDKLEQDMETVMRDVSAIKSMLSEAKGGWRVLMLVAGAAGALGAFISKFIPFLAQSGK